MSVSLLEPITRYRWTLVLASTLILAATLAGLPRTRVVSDFEVFFEPDNTDLLAYHALQDEYTNDDNIMFVVTARQGNVFTAETMAAVEAHVMGVFDQVLHQQVIAVRAGVLVVGE